MWHCYHLTQALRLHIPLKAEENAAAVTYSQFDNTLSKLWSRYYWNQWGCREVSNKGGGLYLPFGHQGPDIGCKKIFRTYRTYLGVTKKFLSKIKQRMNTAKPDMTVNISEKWHIEHSNFRRIYGEKVDWVFSMSVPFSSVTWYI
jgi:GTPase SAR1 family protein